jgi:hypothetical protein
MGVMYESEKDVQIINIGIVWDLVQSSLAQQTEFR